MKSRLKQRALFVFAMFVAQSAQHMGEAGSPYFACTAPRSRSSTKRGG
jgi:hypothetical protein